MLRRIKQTLSQSPKEKALFRKAFSFGLFKFASLIRREFDNAICTAQMAKNGKHRLAMLTIFRFRRNDVTLRKYMESQCKTPPL